MPTWTTALTTPPTPSGLAAVQDPDTSYVAVSWTATATSAAYFWAFILERQVGNGDFVVVATITDVTATSYTDEGAPTGERLTYRLTESNGALLGASTTYDLTQPAPRGWYWVHPGRPDLSTRLHWNRAPFAPKRDKPRSVRYPAGRSGALILEDVTHAPAGTARFYIPSAYTHEIDILLASREVIGSTPGGYGYLKDGIGGSTASRLGAIEPSYGIQGDADLTLEYTGV